MHNSEIQIGDIFLSGGNKFVQKFIRYFTDSLFSHSGCMGSGPGGLLATVETTPTIVTSQPFDRKYEQPDWLLVVEPLASQESKEKAFIKTWKEYVAERYGYETYLWFIYRSLVRKIGFEPKKMWSWASTGVTCTELTCYYLCKLSDEFAAIFSGKDLNTIAPQELMKIIDYNPELFKIKGWLKAPPA